MDPSKREEEPLGKNWKGHKSDNGKGLNNLRHIKGIKQRQSPNLNSPGSESSDNNKTDVQHPLLGGADSKKQDAGDRSGGSHNSKERTSTNIKGGGGGQQEPEKGKENGGSISVIPSVSFDNSVTVVKHLKQSEVSKTLHACVHGNVSAGMCLYMYCFCRH